MSDVILEFTQSLDGYVAGPGVRVDLPMGEGGLRLFEDLAAPIELVRTEVVAGALVTHLHYRIARTPGAKR